MSYIGDIISVDKEHVPPFELKLAIGSMVIVSVPIMCIPHLKEM